jgi:hypothetical protein
MLTRLRIRNLKRFVEADLELGQSVVLIGPNNSGKTTALQALALWDIGLRRWNEKRKGRLPSVYDYEAYAGSSNARVLAEYADFHLSSVWPDRAGNSGSVAQMSFNLAVLRADATPIDWAQLESQFRSWTVHRLGNQSDRAADCWRGTQSDFGACE